jgi:fucose 4-O-acetylase-like acetyltransferase
MKSERDGKIDVLKGVLITLVVVRHYYPGEIGMLVNMIGLFRMPLFLVISSILVKAFDFEFLRKRILYVLVPFLFWNALPLLFLVFEIDLSTAKKEYHILFMYPEILWVSWYLVTVLTINLMFSLYKKLLVDYSRYMLPILLPFSLLTFVLSDTLSLLQEKPLLFKAVIQFFYLFPTIVLIEYFWNKRAD